MYMSHPLTHCTWLGQLQPCRALLNSKPEGHAWYQEPLLAHQKKKRQPCAVSAYFPAALPLQKHSALLPQLFFEGGGGVGGFGPGGLGAGGLVGVLGTGGAV